MEIEMQRTRDQRTIILVEGANDIAVLEPHLDKGECWPLPTGGKVALLATIRLVNENRFKRVLGIADRDWEGVRAAAVRIPNIIYTDFYDIDATALFSGNVCQRVVSSHCDGRTAESQLAAAGQTDPLAVVVAIASEVGLLRLLNMENQWGIKIRDFPTHDVIDTASLQVSRTRLAIIAAGRSRGAVRADKVAAELSAWTWGAYNRRDFCSGHDLISALSFIMKNLWGGKHVGSETAGRAIRAAFSCTEFKATKLYAEVKNWGATRGVSIWCC
ncbi:MULTISPECIES: DUF4435 domain-containing protein [Micromonospora]|uniref:DUF4435 domain-containing protein n=1 Tax=Micromonospora TaxID=1873 RepID=UPI0011D25DE5|nr:DUF4435 domain-containing protein [Micromonospora maris]